MNEKYLNIETKLYKVFYIVCKTGNDTEAAKVLCMTQPAISYNIKRLEEKLNTTLFNRKNNGIELTKEAEVLLPYVEDALASINTGEQKVNALINLNLGMISIGIPSHIGVFLLVEIIKKFNIDHPNIKFKIISKPTNELFKLLHNNSIDMIIDSSPIDTTYDFSIYKIGEVKGAFACHCSRKELLNNKKNLSDIITYPLIVPNFGSSTTKELKKVFQKRGLKFDVQFEISTSDLIANMIDKDIGVGFLLENTIDLYHNVKKIDVEDKLPSFDIYEIYKENNISVLTKKFTDYVIKYFKY